DDHGPGGRTDGTEDKGDRRGRHWRRDRGRRDRGRRDRHRAPRRPAGPARAHAPPAARPDRHPGVARESRLPPEHARDRRQGGPHVVLVGRPPAPDPGGEGLPQARPEPTEGDDRRRPRRGGPDRRRGRPAAADVRPGRRAHRRGRSDPRRGAGGGGLPAPQGAGRRGHLVPAPGRGRLDDRRRHLQRRLRRGPSAADGGERRDRRRAHRRRGDGEDAAAPQRRGVAAPPQRRLRADRRQQRDRPRQGHHGAAPGL
ncbi:MAG: SOS-response repressor and protease LexA, partial [uncultured Nocardioidaceae bacterium]